MLQTIFQLKTRVNNRSLYFLTSLLFVLSGVAALVYQISWFKYLSYFLGNTTYSQSIVLATFMGGLALGSWFWGRKADSSKNTLALFAVLEILIALYCFFYFPIFEFVKSQFIDIVNANGWPSDSTIVLSLKLIVSAATILVPTVLMGGTLPVLVKHLSNYTKEIGRNVSLLYFINSLGAVIGSVLAGFYLLESIGIRNTIYFGAIADGIVGVLVLIIAFSKNSTQKNIKDIKTVKFHVTPKIYRVALTVAGISGLCAMIYEVVWLRLLIPILGSTTYSFSIVLIVFISGITLGSLIVYLSISRIKNPIRFLTICQVGIIVSILLSIPFYEKIPYLIWSDIVAEMKTDNGYSFYLSRQLLYTSLVLIVPTIFMGMSLPIATKLTVKKISSSGRSIGNVFAINTLGTVFGSLLAGLVLIPLIGIKPTLEVALFLNLSLVILLFSFKISLKTRSKVVLFLLILFCSFYYQSSVNNERWTHSIMTSVVPRKINRKPPPSTFDEFYKVEKSQTDSILFYDEGIGGTVVVTKYKGNVHLYTNGKGDAASQGDLRTQINLAQTPMILHPNPEKVFVIGFGAGTTIGNVMTHQSVKQAKVAEISPEVIDASIFFNHVNQNPLADKRLQVIKDDGISALRLSPQKYDIIISQPSNPWSAGVGNLFTQDFFRDCKEKLEKNGILGQWFNLYEMSDETLKMVFRTVLKEFKHVDLWQIGSSDLLMVCSESPINTDLKTLEESFNSVNEPLSLGGINSFPVFLSQQFLSSKNQDLLEKYAYSGSKSDINTENLPLLEHWAPKDYFLYAVPDNFHNLDQRNNIESSQLMIRDFIQNRKGLNYSQTAEIAAFHIYEGNKELALTLADKHPMIYMSWANREIEQGNYYDAIFFINRYARFNRNSALVFINLATIKLKEKNLAASLEYLNEGLKFNRTNSDLYYLRSDINRRLGNTIPVVTDLKKSIKYDSTNFAAYNDLAAIYGQQKQYNLAISVLNKAINNGCDEENIFYNKGSILGLQNEFEKSVFAFSRVIQLNPKNAKAFYLRGKGYLKLGKKDKACSDFHTAQQMGVNQAKQMFQETCK